MSAFSKVKDAERTKLQKELEYYTNLVSNHQAHLQTDKILYPKSTIHNGHSFVRTSSSRQRNLSLQKSNFYNVACVKPTLKYKVNTSLSRQSIGKQSVSAPVLNKSGLSTFKASNSIQQRTVPNNPKSVTSKSYKSVSNASDLQLQAFLNSNVPTSKSQTHSIASSKDLADSIFRTKELLLKVGSKKHIEELKLLTKKLEDKKKNLSLANKVSTERSLKTCSMLTSTGLQQHIGLSPSKNSNLICNNKSKLNILNDKIKNISKKVPLILENVPLALSASSLNLSKTRTSKSPSLKTRKSTTPVTSNLKIPITNSLTGAAIKCSVSLNQISKLNKDVSTKLLKSPKPLHFNSASPSLATLHCLIDSKVSSLTTANVETSKVGLLASIEIAAKESLLSSKEISKNIKVTAEKSYKSLQSNSVVTPSIRKSKPQRFGSVKMPGKVTKLMATKYKVINKRLSSSPQISSDRFFKLNKQSATKLVKNQKNVLYNCVSTPLLKNTKAQKVNSIKRQNLTRLITSKYKVVNKKISNSPAIPNIDKFTNNKLVAIANLDNKGSQNKQKSPVTKVPSFNVRVVSHMKHSKTPKSLPAKSPSPKFVKKGKYVLKKRKMSTYTSPVNAQNIQRRSGLNSSINSASKLHASFKRTGVRLSPVVHSKYKIVNKRASSKKSPKSLNLKGDIVRRTKSGVDIDLLYELAAEKNLAENGVKSDKKKTFLSRRVFKSKNAIVNKNVCPVSGTRTAKMIKMKYMLKRRNAWLRQTPRKFTGAKYYKGFQSNANFHKTPTTHCYNRTIQSRYLKNYEVAAQNNKFYKARFTYRNDHLKNFPHQMKSSPASKALANRALHQSISRVITASVKKKLSKVNTYCMFYNRFGRCNKGLKCTYVHDPSKIAVCTRFLRGTCKQENCLFSHEINPGKMAICSFFLKGLCTKIDCPYRHETLLPGAVLCKAFVQGYCPKGKLCKKAHILVCPQYIQGTCKKGDACAFPHPPSKERKVLPRPIEESERPMEVDDLLMESVSRYFQPSSKSNAITETNEFTVVPRRQKLPEQPSFIAL